MTSPKQTDPGSPRAPASRVAGLLAVLDIETLDALTFRGVELDLARARIFGGLVVAQTLVAATRTVDEGAVPHAFHGLFMRPGDPQRTISYRVTRLRDGRSFAARQCVAEQGGEPIFTATVSFQRPEEGFDHQEAMPAVPGPETLPGDAELLARFGAVLPSGVRRYLEASRPIEIRPTDLSLFIRRPGDQPVPAEARVWVRAAAALPDEPAVHRAVLAYWSDMSLLDTALIPHGRSVFDPGIQAASLDHAMWFHRPFRADEWLLYALDSPNAAGARGLSRGSVFSQDGRLVASTAQEGLIRLRR